MTCFPGRFSRSVLFLVLVSPLACAVEAGPPAPNATRDDPSRRASVLLVGGPTAVIELGGARFLTDPTFSPPGPYPVAPGRTLTKLEGPAVAMHDVGHIDAVLLSHDQHVDNLDPDGRAYVARAPRTYSTPAAAERLSGQVTGLAPWQGDTLVSRNGRRFQITAVPAQHGPDGTESITGAVTGFLLASDRLPTVYVSGDNASLAVVREVAARTRIDVAVLFIGGAKSPRLLGDALLTLDGNRAAEAAMLLPDAEIVPVHFRGWSHFTQGGDSIRAAFSTPALEARLHLLEPGETVKFGGGR